MQASEAFNAVCSMVADKYKDDGWKYAKSKHWMTKKDKKFKYQVRFYTSWNNISDIDVSFYGEGIVKSLTSKETICGVTSFHCEIPKSDIYNGIDWNVAKKENWKEAIDGFTKWLDEVYIPVVNGCMNNLESYVEQVAREGFYPPNGYIVDISFILENGSRELAEEAAKRYYESLEDEVKILFKENYESMINGNEAVSEYGINWMRHHSNYKTIIDNKIKIEL